LQAARGLLSADVLITSQSGGIPDTYPKGCLKGMTGS